MSGSTFERVRALLASGEPGGVREALPYASFMGIDIELVDGDVRGVLRYSDHVIGNPVLPALHGGAIGALLETTAGCKVLFEADRPVRPKIINITVQYLRSGKPRDTYARCIITRQGRRVVNVRAEAWQEDPSRPIASADAHFLIVPLP